MYQMQLKYIRCFENFLRGNEMIISNKQIMHLMQIAENYRHSFHARHSPELQKEIARLLDQIANQQSNKMEDR